MTAENETGAMMSSVRRETNFARPVAPHRGRIYLGTGLLTAAVFLGVTIGVHIGVIAPTFTTDVVVNLIFGVPVLLLPWSSCGTRVRTDVPRQGRRTRPVLSPLHRG